MVKRDSVIKLFLFSLLILLIMSCSQKEQTTKNTPPLTPRWALGHIAWEDSINTQDAALGLIKEYRKREIPVDGIIIDSPWSLSYNDFNWDKARYPKPVEMIQQFKKDNIKVILWLTGCINSSARDIPVQKDPKYDFAKENHYVINNGEESKWWKGPGMHLDFTNKDAVKWWNKRLDKVFIDGIYGWKVDQGEAAFGDTVITSIGKIPQKEFRKYYYNSMFDYAVSKNKNEGMIIARPYSHQTNLDGFAASIEKMSVGWCGDFSGDWSGIKMQINDIYKSADAGYGAIACEIGGFQSKHSTKAQLIRYTQLGSMVATMVNGGSNGAFTNHLPWYHDKETSDIYRYYVNLHYELRNYIFSSLVDAHLHGGSLIKDVSFKEESHKLGNSIFFKAITSDTNMVSFTLPKDGEWIDFWTNEKYAGAAKITKEYALDKAPIFIKMGAIIPLEIDNKVTGLGDKSFAGKIVILLYPKGKSTYLYHKPLGDGIEYSDIEIAYEAGKISVKAEEKNSYVFLIKDQNGVETFEKDGKSFDLVLRK